MYAFVALMCDSVSEPRCSFASHFLTAVVGIVVVSCLLRRLRRDKKGNRCR